MENRVILFLRDNSARSRIPSWIFLKGMVIIKVMDKIALFILLIGGLNWGLVGLFSFDLVAWIFGGSTSVISRIVYILVALSALWCISLFFKKNELVEAE